MARIKINIRHQFSEQTQTEGALHYTQAYFPSLSLPIQIHVSSICPWVSWHSGASPAATFSQKSPPNTNSCWLRASLRGMWNSAQHFTPEESKQRRSAEALRLTAKQTHRQRVKVSERRVTSLTGAETVTGEPEAFFHLFVPLNSLPLPSVSERMLCCK